eukprot:1307841-Heterocapsa_arctica.AAC.1
MITSTPSASAQSRARRRSSAGKASRVPSSTYTVSRVSPADTRNGFSEVFMGLRSQLSWYPINAPVSSYRTGTLRVAS